jgi:L-threonylcarbamoyladenylate synthase
MSRSGKVAFRIPEDPLLREFLVYLGEPLSGTSLNRSGEPPLRSLEEIRMVFPDLAVVDGGFRPGAPVSPILDLTLFDRPVPRRSWRSLPIR